MHLGHVIRKLHKLKPQSPKPKDPLDFLEAGHEGVDALEARFDRPAAAPNAGPQGTDADNMSSARTARVC